VDSRHPARARSGPTLHLVQGTGGDAVDAGRTPEPRAFRRYPLWRVLGLNLLTLGHYLVGCAAVLAAYRSYPVVGWPLGVGYLVFAVVQLYVLMPLVVCPGCVYRTMRRARCASGLNLLSARLCPPAPPPGGFEERGNGAMCQNSLCLWSWILPVPFALPGLVLSFSWQALGLTVAVAVLATVRIAVVERLAVCPHCLARRWCPVERARRAA